MLEGSSLASFIFSIVLILIIIFPFLRVVKAFKNRREKEKAEEEGVKIGAEIGTMKKVRKAFSKVGGKN